MVSVIAGLICSANIASLSLVIASQRRDGRAAHDPLVAESLANAQHLTAVARPRLVFTAAARPAFAFARTALPAPTR
jgi:hypothetical protein